jgi:hypothetical protein
MARSAPRVRPDRQPMPGTPRQNRNGNTIHRGVLRIGRLFWLFVGGVLMVAALRRVLAVVAQLGQLFIEDLDRGFLLAEKIFDQVMPVSFELLLLGKELFNVVLCRFHRSLGSRRFLGHGVYFNAKPDSRLLLSGVPAVPEIGIRVNVPFRAAVLGEQIERRRGACTSRNAIR